VSEIKTEYGWVIESRHTALPQYLTVVDRTMFGFSTDPYAAIRFSRMSDAEAVLIGLRYEMHGGDRWESFFHLLIHAVVCEHGWDERTPDPRQKEGT